MYGLPRYDTEAVWQLPATSRPLAKSICTVDATPSGTLNPEESKHTTGKLM